jgi:FkbM family methyltransferase
MNRIIEYKYLGKKWRLNLLPQGDFVSDLFNTPTFNTVYPWLLSKSYGTFIDIGAHIGTTTIHAAPFYKNLIAFEPCLDNFAILKKNVSENNITNVKLYDKAVSDVCGFATFYMSESAHTGGNSLIKKANLTVSTEVETVTLDHVFSSELYDYPKIDFIKIDIEGYEPKAIRSCENTLRKQQARPIFKVEFNPNIWSQNEKDVHWLFEYLSINNYIPMLETSGFISPIGIGTFIMLYNDWKNLIYDSWLDVYFVPIEFSTAEFVLSAYKTSQLIFSKLSQ